MIVCSAQTALGRQLDGALCVFIVLVDDSIYSGGKIVVDTSLNDGHVKRFLHGAWSG